MITTGIRLSEEPLLLASSSPRRIETLRGYGFPIVVSPADVDESSYDSLPVGERVQALAELKVRTASAAAPEPPYWALGADTLVALDGEVFGKPSDEAEARAMLRALSGRTHRVLSGLCALDRRTGRAEKALSETSVTFSAMSGRELDWYIASGEWWGVAGAYRVQERAAFFVERIDGSFSGVVGLPLHAFYAILSRIGYPIP